jgi:hypothetical protein
MTRIRARLIAPLLACGISGSAAVVGGACFLFPSAIKPPTLQTGTYTLMSANGQSPPVVFVDSTGRSVRVVADTFALGANQFYDEHVAAAIKANGGVEQPVSLVVIGHQPYFLPNPASVTFLLTVYGASTPALILSPTSFELQLSDHSVWRYERR